MLSSQQNLFLEHLLDLGDRDLAMKRFGLTTRVFIDWMLDPDFKNEVEKIENYYIENLTTKIGQQGLKKLDFVLRHGIKTTTLEKNVTFHPEFGRIETEKRKTQNQSVSMPAIREAIKIFIMVQVQKDVLANVSALASRGLLPKDTEVLVSSTMDEYQRRVKDALKGDFEKVGINEDMLAQIQQLVISG